MKTRKKYQWLWAISVLVTVTLACGLIDSITQTGQEARGTAQSVATDVEEGRLLLETGRAVVTEVLNSEVLQTAQAFATSEGPRLLATAQSFVTEGAPLVDTAQAYATEQGPGLVETGQAMRTELAQGMPEDIPVLEQNMSGFFGSAYLVTYTSGNPDQEIIDFYREEMPVNGWTLTGEENQEVINTTILSFEKEGRQSTVTVTSALGENQSQVIITIEGP